MVLGFIWTYICIYRSIDLSHLRRFLSREFAKILYLTAVHRLIAGRTNYRLSAKLAPAVQRTVPIAKWLNGSTLSRISLILAAVVEREAY